MNDATDGQPQPAPPTPPVGDDGNTDPWAYLPDDEEGSTWELHQDAGTFPPWV